MKGGVYFKSDFSAVGSSHTTGVARGVAGCVIGALRLNPTVHALTGGRVFFGERPEQKALYPSVYVPDVTATNEDETFEGWKTTRHRLSVVSYSFTLADVEALRAAVEFVMEDAGMPERIYLALGRRLDTTGGGEKVLREVAGIEVIDGGCRIARERTRYSPNADRPFFADYAWTVLEKHVGNPNRMEP